MGFIQDVCDFARSRTPNQTSKHRQVKTLSANPISHEVGLKTISTWCWPGLRDTARKA
jgi:hypothetical protein